MSEELVINRLFTETVQKFSSKICLRAEKNGAREEYTYAQVDELSRKIAVFLIKKGIKKGDFIFLILENSPEWAISYLGILYSGACAVPVDPQAVDKEIENIKIGRASCRERV